MPAEPKTIEAPYPRSRERRLNTTDRLPSMLTVDEASALLRVNRKTIYEAVRLGLIPGAVRLGTTIRISKASLLAWVASAGLKRD